MKLGHRKHHPWRAPAILGTLLVLIVLFSHLFLLPDAQARPAAVEVASPAAAPDLAAAPQSLCRYGIAAGEEAKNVISDVGAGWFLKFNYPIWYGSLPDNDSEQAHMIKTFQKKDKNGNYLSDYRTSMPLGKELANYLKTHPGGLWIIGNEVDRGPQPGEVYGGQGDMYPDMYAVAYHEIRSFIKANDPTARVANSALVQVTPGRIQYLNRVWDAYLQKYGRPMPVDVWNMHLYALPEVLEDGHTPNSIANIALGTDPTLGKRGSGGDPNKCPLDEVYCKAEHDDIAVFAEQVRLMRQWMKDHGQQQKPLILSEFSILYSYAGEGHAQSVRDEYGKLFSPERVSAFMVNAFNYLEGAQDPNLGYAVDNNRLVQQWLWFAAYSWWGSSSDLVQADLQTMTQMGETYRSYVANQQPVIDLVVDEIPRSVATTGADGTAVALLDIPLRNAGNATLQTPFRVSFYADEARTQLVDSILVSPNLRGCATAVLRVQGRWSGLTPGLHSYWVYVDSSDAIPEFPAGTHGNIRRGTVLVNTERTLLPVTLR